MGLFDKFKKNKESAVEESSSEKIDIKKLWAEAYKANPRVYAKDGGHLLVNFALTEDVDSLFPLYPEKNWAITGKEIDLWMITMVSLTSKENGGIIGQMEYHEAMKRLEPYILLIHDEWALIRGMTYEELDGLFGDLPRKLV